MEHDSTPSVDHGVGRSPREWRDAAVARLKRIRRSLRIRHRPLDPLPPRRTLYPADAPDGGWEYHDERWVRVIHRNEHRRLLQEGRALVVHDNRQSPGDDVACGADGSIRAVVPADGPQKWVWLHLDPARHSWRDFRWELTVRRDTDFRELQFGFRYVDFYNRYRFRHEDDALHFDIVVNGVFWNSIFTTPFRMDAGRDYRWRIEVRDNRFVLSIDGAVLLDEIDKRRLFPRGPIAVILWEDDGRTPIEASITDQRVVEL